MTPTIVDPRDSSLVVKSKEEESKMLVFRTFITVIFKKSLEGTYIHEFYSLRFPMTETVKRSTYKR